MGPSASAACDPPAFLCTVNLWQRLLKRSGSGAWAGLGAGEKATSSAQKRERRRAAGLFFLVAATLEPERDRERPNERGWV